MMWTFMNEPSGLARVIDCAEIMWIAGCAGFIFGAVIGSGIYHLLKNWEKIK